MDEVHTAWLAARAAYPDVELDEPRFAAHVARHGGVLRHGADLYLACACLHGDARAIRRFDDDVLVPASVAVRQLDDAAAFLDEVRQRLREALLVGATPRIGAYAGRGPLRAWVGVSAVRAGLMIQRSRRRAREDDLGPALALVSTGNPELDLLKQQHARAFADALTAACAALEPRLRAALRLHLVDELSIDQIGAAYGVHRATAARWLQRAKDEVAVDTHRRLRDVLALTPSELDRVASLVRSQLDVSLSQLLL